ncbi:MAG: hypothetical protein IGS39_01175 [Calothrix sp. C42_A2020_038]|nr:hypothetical protein [Calothrix sp. C42_A2020_038]
MLHIVITINILISIVLLYVAWRVWLLKRSFVRIANTLNRASRSTHTVLSVAPNLINKRQLAIQNLRLKNQGLESQYQKLNQILSLVILASRFGRKNVFKTTIKK